MGRVSIHRLAGRGLDLCVGITWKPGILDLGLKEGGVDYAVDDNNKAILSAEVRAKADQAKADIISGKIQVHDYMSDNKCPM